jgi:UDP-N-acetylmuramate dehydrogenase
VILRVHLRLSTTAVFHLDYGPLQALRQRPGLSQAEVRQRVRLIRAAKLPDPSIQPNVGSFFKNPRVDAAHWQVLRMRFPDLVSFPVDASGGRKLAAGWLIERAGWKGVSRQGVTVHPLQALVLINSGQARRQDVQTLADAICVSVWRCFGVALEREPVWVD